VFGQVVEPPCQLHDGQRELAGHLGNDAADGDRDLQLVVVHQTHVLGVGIVAGVVVLPWSAPKRQFEPAVELFDEDGLDVTAMQAYLPHRVEVQVMVGIAVRAVGHLEQRIVGAVEQLPQQGDELLAGLLADRIDDRRYGLRAGAVPGERDDLRMSHVTLLPVRGLPMTHLSSCGGM
jgi:hypothetical protein